MNWYLQSGKDSDIAVSTKIRLLRNIKGYKFEINTKSEMESLENQIKEKLFEINYGLKFFKLEDMDDITKACLVEKNLITSKFAFVKNNMGSILINDEENICIMIGGKDNLEIQVFNAGLDLENTLNLAIEIDEKLDKALAFCKNKKYGYLTSSLTNVGTGLKASVVVHLPGLSKTQNVNKILNTVSTFGVENKTLYGENLSDMYEISNKQTLGISEKEIIKNVNIIVQKIIQQEREARRFLAKDVIDVEDAIYRNFGVLTNCRKITYEEVRKILSNIKMGTDLGILKELDDLKIQKLYLYTKPANLQKYLGEQYESIEQDIKRAEVIKQIINEK